MLPLRKNIEIRMLIKQNKKKLAWLWFVPKRDWSKRTFHGAAESNKNTINVISYQVGKSELETCILYICQHWMAIGMIIWWIYVW